jgi:predicted Zn finger-like uncharacterized protein
MTEAAITQCPECSTRFRVSAEQLAAHDGMVRCGRCNHVFNAAEQLHDDQPSPQLDLPIAALAPEAENVAEPLAEPPRDDAPAAPSITAIADEPGVLEHQFQFDAEVLSEEISEPVPKPLRWPWLVGSLLLLLTLSAQAVYFYRIEIAARLPGLKPVLASYCGLLQCTIPLPKKADLMSIESSDLESDPQQSNVITLSALLHNRAGYTQAYPSLELSLTDLEDKIVARRTFMPAEYLKAGEDEKLGVAANREMSIKLRMETADLKPAGYKLFLFYPQ